MSDVKIDLKYLEGIMFNDVKTIMPKEKDKEGRKKVVYEKISRKLLLSDVLSVKETDNEVIFVTADGQKYTKIKTGKLGG